MLRTLIPFLVLFLLPVLAGICWSAEPQNPESPPAAQPAAQPEAPGKLEKTLTGIGEKVDKTHDRIERDILEKAIRFDDSFGTAKRGEPRKTSYELRWKNSLRIEQDGHLRPGVSVRASAVLSKISNRLHLAISGEKEPEPFAQSLPQDPGTPGFDRTTPTTRIVNTELRYGLMETPSVDWFIGAGVRIALPFEVFIRSRYQHTCRLSDISLIRVAETPFIKNTDWLGETTELTMERLLNQRTLLQSASSATASEEIAGIEWGSELSLIHRLSEKSAVTLTVGAYGNSNGPAVADNYRVLARYRRNFLRKWLYYEVEPEVSWPRTVQGTYQARFAFTGRIEIVFQGSAMGDKKQFSSSEDTLEASASAEVPSPPVTSATEAFATLPGVSKDLPD